MKAKLHYRIILLVLGSIALMAVIAGQAARGEYRDRSSYYWQEAKSLVENFIGLGEPYTVLAFKFPMQDTPMSAVVLFSGENPDTDSNLLFVTPVGTGVVTLGGREYSFQYLPEKGLIMTSNDTVAVSFADQNSADIYDFQLQCTITGPCDVLFKSSSQIR